MNQVFGFRPDALEKAQFHLKNGNQLFQSALNRLVVVANELLSKKPTSVIDKTETPASGDRHDYLSFATYFWPDPEKKDGLPYIRKDCQINPEIYSERSDKLRLKEMTQRAETLALAYFLTGNESYAEKVALQLRMWFLDPKTRMNPNLNYAQVIPGLNDGRSFGVLDGHYLLSALDAAGMLARSKPWSEADHASLIVWITGFLQWLQKSKNGRKESTSINNHCTLYDVQIAHLALFIGDKDLARRTTAKAKTRRIAAQIKPDGSQPYELRRAESLQYSQYNLEAFFRLATHAEHAGIDLWHYQTIRGAGIRKALDFLLPYLEEPESRWPYPGNQREPNFDSVLCQANRVYGDERYLDILRKNPESAHPLLADLIR